MPSVYSKSRQQILETASKLFYERGIQNVGINEVIAASGVAKRALYRHFPLERRIDTCSHETPSSTMAALV